MDIRELGYDPDEILRIRARIREKTGDVGDGVIASLADGLTFPVDSTAFAKVDAAIDAIDWKKAVAEMRTEIRNWHA